MSGEVKVGLIGAGRWAEVHKQALTEVGATLKGVTVSSPASKERVEAEWGVPATTDLDTFLGWDTDAVIVVSPNYLHAEHAVAALNAGKHVLVEKPMATTLEDCERMLAAAERVGKTLAVGLEMRVFTLFAKVKALIEEGAVGRPLHLKLDLWRRPYRAGAGGWKTDPDKLGSAILEEPIHYLDLARWYFSSVGEPVALQAWSNSRDGREMLNENLDVRLEFPQASALVTRSIAAYGHHVDLKLVGETGALHAAWCGSMDLDRSPHVALTLHSDEETRGVDVPRSTGHAFDVPKQTAAFLAAVHEKTQPPATGEDGRASVALSLAAEASLRRGEKLALVK